MGRTRSIRFLILCAAVIAAAPAVAFKMSPIVLYFSPAGRDATRSILLENQSDAPEAIELAIHARDMTLDGDDALTPAEDDFIVTPQQLILMPGQQQTVRVQWLGGAVEKERAYRLVAEQLPIDIGDAEHEGGRVRFLVRYVASLYVAPDGARPSVSVADASIARSESGGVLTFTVTNSGAAHAALSDLVVNVFRDKGDEPIVTLGADELGEISGAIVLAERSRRFVIPLAADIPAGPARVTLDYGAR